MANKDYEFLSRKAEILKAIAHPVRLSILRDLVQHGEKRVSDLETSVEIPMATISQHLAKMSYAGLFKKRRNGIEIYYSLVNDDKIVELIKSYL